MPAFRADEHEGGAGGEGGTLGLRDDALRKRRLWGLRQPEQQGGDTPAEHADHMSSGPEDAHMRLPQSRAAICGDEAAFAHAAKDQLFTQDGMHQADEDEEHGGGEEVDVHDAAWD